MLLALAVAACGAPAARIDPADLRLTSFDFDSGLPFDGALAGVRTHVVFGHRTDVGRLATVVTHSTAPGEDSMSQTRGTFDPESCSFDFDQVSGSAVLPAALTLRSCAFDASAVTLTLGGAGGTVTSSTGRALYNFVVIVTDDHRWDSLWGMPTLNETLGSRGTLFSNAFGSVSLCCPWRASFLSGGFHAHTTGVLANDYPNGGALLFADTSTLATHLFDFGYRTGLFGKYMNGYSLLAPTIPPGWTEFVAHVGGSDYPENSWSDFWVASGGSGFDRREGGYEKVDEYSLDFFERRAAEFIAEGDGLPFFLYLTTRAPHYPATPDPDDLDAFPDFVYQQRGYDEQDMSDKPGWVRALGRSRWPRYIDQRRDWPAEAMRSLLAVDRMVGRMWQRLQDADIADRTIVVFTSDGGEVWGEHQLWGKVYHYDEAMRVPLLVYFPGAEAGVEPGYVVNNLDLPATIMDLLGIDNHNEGNSLLPLFRDGAFEPRDHVYAETFFQASSGPERQAASVRSVDEDGEWKYVEHYVGERELYNMSEDPYELVSLHDDPAMADRIQRLEELLATSKALGFTSFFPPAGRVGQPYEFLLTAAGGRPPYSFGLYDGDRLNGGGLPPGLELDPASGLISGVPTSAFEGRTLLKVTDSSVSVQSGRPQVHHLWFRFRIGQN